MIRFEQLATHESSRLRSIRLCSLQEAPDAFGTTFEEASQNGDEVWVKQLAELPTFIAVKDGRDVGMVRCARDKETADTAWLISMWVASEARRNGVGSALVDLVVAWARANGMSRLLLDVANLNAPAIALYEVKGFKATGKSGSMPPPREHIQEHQRELRLG